MPLLSCDIIRAKNSKNNSLQKNRRHAWRVQPTLPIHLVQNLLLVGEILVQISLPLVRVYRFSLEILNMSSQILIEHVYSAQQLLQMVEQHVTFLVRDLKISGIQKVEQKIVFQIFLIVSYLMANG